MVNFCVKRSRLKPGIIITHTNMKTDKIFNPEGLSYEAPSVTSLDILSEGLLCQSFGDAGRAGKDLDTENEWDF